MRYLIIETDNYGGDYPDESFLPLPAMTQEHAHAVVSAINAAFGEMHPRYWREVPVGYVLKPGFEP